MEISCIACSSNIDSIISFFLPSSTTGIYHWSTLHASSQICFLSAQNDWAPLHIQQNYIIYVGSLGAFLFEHYERPSLGFVSFGGLLILSSRWNLDRNLDQEHVCTFMFLWIDDLWCKTWGLLTPRNNWENHQHHDILVTFFLLTFIAPVFRGQNPR